MIPDKSTLCVGAIIYVESVPSYRAEVRSRSGLGVVTSVMGPGVLFAYIEDQDRLFYTEAYRLATTKERRTADRIIKLVSAVRGKTTQARTLEWWVTTINAGNIGTSQKDQ